MPDSTLAAIVVCTLIGFFILVVAAIIFIVLLRRRRQRQKEAAAEAQQTVVGPSTKPIQPTHNGTWSGSFHGLWKAQTWREMPEDDELPLSDRANGSTRSVIAVHQLCLLITSLFFRSAEDIRPKVI